MVLYDRRYFPCSKGGPFLAEYPQPVGTKRAPLEQLNFEENDLKNLRKAIHGTQGLILVTGPTGSGKTTTPQQPVT